MSVNEVINKAATKMIPYLSFLVRDKELIKFSPRNMEAKFAENSAQVTYQCDLGKVTHISDYARNRIANVNGFTDVKIGTTTLAELKDVNPETAKQIKEQVSNTLELNLQTINAFNDRIKKLNDLIAEPNQKFELSDVAYYLQKVKTAAISAIQKQQQQELKNIETLFEPQQPFRNALEGITDSQPQIDKVKQDMIDALNKKHQEELTKFTQGMDEDIIKQHKIAQHVRDRIATLAVLREANRDKMDNELESARKQSTNNQLEPLSMSFNINDPLNLAAINPKFIKTAYTITGRPINHTYNAEKGSQNFHMDLPVFGLTYYYGFEDKPNYDFTSMANFVKACIESDEDVIFTLSITDTNEKTAKQTARDAYQAFIKAGFDPSTEKDKQKLFVKLNGKEISIDDLYTNVDPRNSNKTPVGQGLDAAKNAAQENKNLKDQYNKQRENQAESSTSKIAEAAREINPLDQQEPRIT